MSGLFQVISMLFFSGGFLPGNDTIVQIHPVNTEKISAVNNSMIDYMVVLVNRGEAEFRGSFSVEATRGLDPVTRNRAVSISANDSLFITVKVWVSSKADIDLKNSITNRLTGYGGAAMSEVKIPVDLRYIHGMDVDIPETTKFFRNENDTVVFPVHITNTGNATEKIRLIFTASSAQKMYEMKLKASGDTTINYSIIAGRSVFQRGGTEITMAGLYNNGDVFESLRLKVNRLQSKGYYGADSVKTYLVNSSGASYISSGYRYYSSGLSSINLSSKNSVLINKNNSINYSFDATTWLSDDKIIVRNTFLNYKSKYADVMAGNIFRSYEKNLNGRGLAIDLKALPGAQKLEIGFIDNSFNLFENFDNSKGYSGWVRYSTGKRDNPFTASFVTKNDKLEETSGQILTLDYRYAKNKKYSVYGRVSTGLTSPLTQEYGSKAGTALQADFDYKYKTLKILSSNKWSSSWYPGVERGITNLTEQFNYSNQKLNLNGAVRYFRMSPRDFNNRSLPDLSNTTADLGISMRKENLTFSIYPRFYKETQDLTIPALMMQQHFAFQAYGSVFSGTLNTVRRNDFLSFYLEAGRFNSDNENKGTHFKSVFSYTAKSKNINASYQVNPFSVNDMVIAGERKYTAWNISGSWSFDALKDRLQVRMGYGYTLAGNGYKSDQGSIEAEYTSPGNLMPFMSLYSNNILSDERFSFSFQAGIKRNLGRSNLQNRHRLQVFVFRDYDNDDKLSEADSAASGFMVSVNERIFISDFDGNINYTRLPAGSYYVKVESQFGWYSEAIAVRIDGKRENRIEIPLHRTYVVRGSINFVKSDYEVTYPHLDGILVTALSGTGITYYARTDEKGNYSLNLPDGEYTLQLSDENLASGFKCINNNLRITVKNKNSNAQPFLIKQNLVNIEIRKFGSK
jgi:hypothetical protein